jgi:tetratricopeptide (TPR) repeat protein
LIKIARIVLLIVVTGWGVNSHAQQSRFDEANILLEESNYREAIQLYKSIAEDGYHAGALWLNLGYAYTQIDSLGMAKYYLLKAEKYPETRQLASEALDFVNNRFSRRSAVLPPLPWDRFFLALSDVPGVRGLVYIALFFLYAGAAFVIASWFRYDLRKLFRYSGYTSLGIAAVFLLFSVIVHYQDNRYGTGVMVARQGQVFQYPRTESAVITTAYEGYTMRVDFRESREYTEWKYVRLENGMYGWVQEELLKVF